MPNNYIFLGNFQSLSEWITPYGKQQWTLCRTRKPFTCIKSGGKWPAGTYAWRPSNRYKNKHERIAVDHSLDTRSLASIVVGHPTQARFVKVLLEARKPVPLHHISQYAQLSYERAERALESLDKKGLVHVVDEWGPTRDWWMSDGMAHESYVVDFVER